MNALRLFAAALFCACVGCSRACTSSTSAADASEQESVLEAAAPIFAPSRCAVSADAVTFDKLGVGEVAGDVALLGDRVIVSCVRKGMNAVGVTGLALDHVEWASLGVAFGDAPPPVLVTSRDQAYALSWERVDASSSRTLAVTKLLPSAALAWSIAEPDASESFAADAAFAGAHGLVAWDTSRGIKVSALTPGSQLVPLPLSAEGALASAPRVVRRKTDWVVVWSERKVEALADGAPRTQPGELIESPGEHRAYEWLAFAVVADDGTTKAPPKRITAETGHVGRFDLLLAADDSIDVYANDEADTGARDDLGGRILRVTLRGDRAETAVAVVLSGVGSGAPAVQRAASSSWLFYEDPLGRARAQPLGVPGLPSFEPSLDDARLEVATGGDAWLGVSSSALVRIRCGEPADH